MYPIHRKRYFNVHHKDWSAYSSETHRPDELCYNSNSSTEIVDFLAGIHDCDSHSPTLLCSFFGPYYLLYVGFAFIKNFFCFSFQSLSFKLKRGCHFSVPNLWLIFCWLGRSLYFFEMCYGRILLNLVLLMLVLDFTSRSMLKLMSSLNYLSA